MIPHNTNDLFEVEYAGRVLQRSSQDAHKGAERFFR